MKRMTRALEVRRLIDQILDANPAARIVVAGDFKRLPGRGAGPSGSRKRGASRRPAR
jgi:hypothetical protein